MTVTGTWLLYFNLECSGTYYRATITFSENGTFTVSDSATGTWAQLDGMVTWQYDGGITVYAGNVVGGVIVGMIAALTEPPGCFYCLRNPSPNAETDAAPARNSAGR